MFALSKKTTTTKQQLILKQSLQKKLPKIYSFQFPGDSAPLINFSSIYLLTTYIGERG